MVTPTAGFDAATRIAGRREKAGATPAEGWSPYILSALGGAALMLLWLKVGALISLREGTADDFRWLYLVAASFMGAGVGLLAQVVWSLIAGRVVSSLGGSARGRDLRLVWGASAFPQVFALFLLVPIDLLVAGPHSFTSARLDDPVATLWSSLSIALAVALAVWSLVLFVRGLEVVGGLRRTRAVAGAAVATGCLLLVVFAFRSLAVAAAGGAS